MFAIRIVTAAILVVLTAPFPLAQADDGCQYPFVWREAFTGDHVVPATRSQAARDNAAAGRRVSPYNHDYGPDTCVGGFVWREARRSDHVCVTLGIRTQAANDNAAAPGRYAGSGVRTRMGNAAGCCPQSMLVCPLGRSFCH